MITAWRFDSPGSWRSLAALPPLRVSMDWYGAPLDAPMEFRLGIDRDRLWFGAAIARQPECDLKLRPGDFVEGLWEHDVAELFLGESTGAPYREFNVSPRGAWWSCSFGAPRIRASAEPLSSVETWSDVSTERWQAGLAVPLRELGLAWSETHPLRVNMTACLGQPQRYVTATRLSAPAPDFHLPQQFPLLRLAAA